MNIFLFFFFFQAEDGIRDFHVTGVQKCALPISVAPKPVNVLIGGALGLSVKDLAEIGVRRISVGGALARAAWGGFIRAARAIAEAGTFDALADAVPFAELNGFFRQNLERRRP